MGEKIIGARKRQVAEKEAADRRATEAQVLEDAERLIAAWNERQALFPRLIGSSPGAVLTAVASATIILFIAAGMSLRYFETATNP